MTRIEPAHRRRRNILLAGLAALAIVLAAWAILNRKPQKTPPPHPIPVTAVTAQPQDFQLAVTALGAAQAWTSDMILAQVTGKLIRVNFTEGSDVRAGQVLAEVDPRPYQAVLTQAEGALKRDEALLAGARRDLVRYQHLAPEGATARQILEDEEALVAQYEGTVVLDRGAVAAARLNLEFCRIVSPIAGRAGVRLVDPGNLVSATGSISSLPNTSSAASSAAPATPTTTASPSASAGPTPNAGSTAGTGIVVINQVQPIAVTFSVPQGELHRLVEASGGFKRPLPVQALSQETGELLGTGVLTIADNRVDQTAGTVALKARFPNPDRRLWPGQFVNVSLGVENLPNAIVIPFSAVNRGPNGQYVFVVGADHRATVHPVTLVAVQGLVAVVKTGVRAGDVIVTDGQMVLNNGSLVRVTNPVPARSPGP